MQPSPSAVSFAFERRATTRSTTLATGLLVAVLLIVLAAVGASAEHGAGAAQLRRGPASIVFSVLITVTGLAGVGSLGLLFWGLVTRNRRRTDSSTRTRHSPVLLAGLLLATFACLSGLLVVALHRRHIQSLPALGGAAGLHAARPANPLPFNEAASFTTSGIVAGVVVLFVLLRFARSLGWRRALRRLAPLRDRPEKKVASLSTAPADLGPLGQELAELTVPDPTTEPDPRRAVIACYLQLLEVAARHGPERLRAETPTEYLHRVLARSRDAYAPATSLTSLFEKARYSVRPVDETMRSGAIAALAALKSGLLSGAPG